MFVSVNRLPLRTEVSEHALDGVRGLGLARTVRGIRARDSTAMRFSWQKVMNEGNR